jgi:hypothetical protein
MFLDDEPILARKLEAKKQSDALVDLCQRACPAIAAPLGAFEKYCGPVHVYTTLISPDSVRLTAGFSYNMPSGEKMRFTATVGRRRDDLVLIDRRGSAPIPVPEPGYVALAFLESITPQAEAAFEAIVLDEPWRLMRLLR